MEIIAPISSMWRKQKFLLSFFLVAVGCWFFYDGLVGYPKKNEAYNTYKTMEAEHRVHEWPTVAKEKGWPREAPHRLYEKPDIAAQIVLGSLSMTAGLLTGFWVSRVGRATLRSDGTTVWDAHGRAVPFTAITGVDDRRWKTKGLADVLYNVDGRRGKIRFDDYKFDGCEKIYAQIEDHLAARHPAARGQNPAEANFSEESKKAGA
jgi:hypothetical protein